MLIMIMPKLYRREIFKSIIGQQIYRAWRGYQSVIFLECGIEESIKKGEYTIGFDYCPWHLLDHKTEIVSGNSPLMIIEDSIQKLVGAKVEHIDFHDSESISCLQFSNGLVIETTHSQPSYQWYLISSNQEVVVGHNCKITVSPIS